MESLADAKESARQQCVYEGPQQKIYSKSTICDFLIMANSNHGQWGIFSELLSRKEVESRHFHDFRLLYSGCRPPADERPAISMQSIHC